MDAAVAFPIDDVQSLASSLEETPPEDADLTITFHELTYATGEGRLLLDGATGRIPAGSCCAVVGPAASDKAALLRIIGGQSRGGYGGGRVAFGGRPRAAAAAACVLVEAEAPPSPGALLAGSARPLAPEDEVAAAAALYYGHRDHERRPAWAATARASGTRAVTLVVP